MKNGLFLFGVTGVILGVIILILVKGFPDPCVVHDEYQALPEQDEDIGTRLGAICKGFIILDIVGIIGIALGGVSLISYYVVSKNS